MRGWAILETPELDTRMAIGAGALHSTRSAVATPLEGAQKLDSFPESSSVKSNIIALASIKLQTIRGRGETQASWVWRVRERHLMAFAAFSLRALGAFVEDGRRMVFSAPALL